MYNDINYKNTFLLEKISVYLIALSIFLMYASRSFFYGTSSLVILISIYLIRVNNISLKKVLKFKIPIVLIGAYTVLLLCNYMNVTESYSKNISMILNLLYLFSCYYFYHLSSNYKINSELFLKVYFYSISLLSFLFLLSFIIEIDIINFLRTLKVDIFRHASAHAGQSFVVMGIGFFIYFTRTQEINIKLNYSLLFIIIIGTFITRGGTALISLSFALVAYFLTLNILENKFSLKKILVFIFIILMFCISFLYTRNYMGEFDLNKITSLRYNGWVTYINAIINDNTWFGYGIFGGKELFNQGILAFKHPHNIFVEVLFTTGIVGFIVMISIWFLYMLKIFKFDCSNELKALIVTTFVVVLMTAQGFWSIWAKNHVIPIVMLISISFILKKYDENLIRGN